MSLLNVSALKIRVAGRGVTSIEKGDTVRAGWLTAKYFPQDTKQTVVLVTNPPPRLVISLFLSRIGIKRDHHLLLFSFMSFSLSLSGCLVLSPSQSFTRQLTISPSRSHQQHQLILSLSCHRRLSHSPSHSRNWNSLCYYCSPPPVLFAPPSAWAPFLALSLTPYLPFPLFSISLAQWQSLSPWNVSRQLTAMLRVQGGPLEAVTATTLCTTPKQLAPV